MANAILSSQSESFNDEITSETLKEILHYDPNTGVFTWLPRKPTTWMVKTWNSRHAGNEAGGFGLHGYRMIPVSRKSYLAHRLAWLYMTGQWPVDDIDHINGDRKDNRFSNLREATRAQNIYNQSTIRAKSGYRGVKLHKKTGTYHARIAHEGQAISLGYFETAEMADVAYRTAEKLLRGKWVRGERAKKFSSIPHDAGD